MSLKESFNHPAQIVHKIAYKNANVRIKTLLSGISFWLAIVLPFVYLAVLMIDPGGVDTVMLVLLLVALNVVALIGGHSYKDPHRHL